MKRWVSWAILLGALAITGAAASQDVSAVPPPPTTFAAPDTDPAGRAARAIAMLVPQLPNLRAGARLGQWRLDDHARWSVRGREQCLAELAAMHVEVESFETTLTPIPTPVRLISDIGGVHYRKRRSTAPFIISCELAVRLAHLSEVLRAHGVDTVDVSSSWRRAPMTSFHRMGLAIDVIALRGPEVEWIVERDYRPDRARATCPAPDGPALQALACEIADGGFFSTVITPSYSPGHRDHFHIDTRPDDPRVFVR